MFQEVQNMEKQETKIVKRSANWGQDEKDILSNLVLNKLDIIENAKIDTNTNRKKKEAWNTTLDLFNKVSKTNRSLDQIQNQWRKTKSTAKSKNSAYKKQMKQTGGGPPPVPLNDIEEQLVTRLPSHFEIDSNMYDSNSVEIVSPIQNISDNIKMGNSLDKSTYKNQATSVPIKISNSEDDNSLEFAREISYESQKPKILKRKNNEKCDENSKRIALLDISIKQKDLEMKYAKIAFEEKKKLLELNMSQMREEHQLKIEKLKIEIENLKKSGYFN